MLNPSLIKYQNNNGHIALATIQGKFTNHYFETIEGANEFIQEHNHLDCYSNVATFKTPYRNAQNILTLTEHYVDIDNHLSPFTKEQAIEFLENVLKPLFDIALPIPSLVNFTGRGLQIHFNMYGATDIVKWGLTQQALLERITRICYEHNALLNAYGLEIDQLKDNVRYTRNAYTYNTKGGKECEPIFISENVYLQDEIINDYNLTFTVCKGKRKKEHNLNELNLNKEQVLKATQKELKAFKQFNKLYTTETLNQARREDLLTLIGLRNAQGINEGYRGNLIGIAVQLERERTTDINELYERTQGFNNYFNEPLKETEVIAWVRSSAKKQCYFTNKGIIDKLGISEQEQEKLSVIISRKVKNKRYYSKHKDQVKFNRRERYRPTRIQNKAIRNTFKAQAKELQAQGLNQQEIAKKLGKGQATISRYLKG